MGNLLDTTEKQQPQVNTTLKRLAGTTNTTDEESLTMTLNSIANLDLDSLMPCSTCVSNKDTKCNKCGSQLGGGFSYNELKELKSYVDKLYNKYKAPVVNDKATINKNKQIFSQTTSPSTISKEDIINGYN